MTITSPDQPMEQRTSSVSDFTESSKPTCDGVIGTSTEDALESLLGPCCAELGARAVEGSSNGFWSAKGFSLGTGVVPDTPRIDEVGERTLRALFNTGAKNGSSDTEGMLDVWECEVERLGLR